MPGSVTRALIIHKGREPEHARYVFRTLIFSSTPIIERTDIGDYRVAFTTENSPAPLVANVKILRGLLKPKTFSAAIFT